MSDKKEIDQTLPLSGHVKDRGHAPVSADEFTLPLVESESAAGNGGAENIFDEQTLALVPQTVSLAGPQSPDVRTVLLTPANRQDTKAIVPLAWQAGDVILDLYEVRGVFGEGATATVYKVFHRDWNLELAVKSPLPAVLKMAGWAENFEQEAETWVNLGLHPHCVSCYYVRRLGGVPRLFAECVDGGDLHAWIVNGTLYRDGPEVALARMIDIAIQFAWGLQHAHDQGLVHQDVKPANVMMTANGIAKVTDFGLAKAHSIVDERVAAGGGKPQNSAATCGGMTPAYCSPEQARIVRKAQEGVPLDRCGKLTPASDIWSWAVAVFEMFAREPIWKRGEMADTGLDHFLKSGTPDAAAPAMPTGLVTVLRKCLNRNPAKRPASLQLIAEELQLVYRETAGSAYFRPVPKSAEALADSLNNRAVSLLDLGRLEEAGSCWEKALELHPNHPESTVNAGLTRWRNGTIHDTELVRRVSEVRGAYGNDWKCDHLISLIHLERGRFDEALQLLNNLTGADRTSTEIKQTTDIAQQRCASSRRLQETLSGHASAVNSVWLSDDGSKVLSGSGAPFAFARQKDYSVRLWEARSGACLYTLQGHSSRVNAVCLSGDGLYGLSGSVDMSVKVWDLDRGRCLQTCDGHTETVLAVCFSPDAGQAVSSGRDRVIRLWDTRTGNCLAQLAGHEDSVTAVAFAQKAALIASAGDDMTVRVWDPQAGSCLNIFSGHSGKVTSVSISADGRFVLSGSEDAAVKLWHVDSGRCIKTFSGHNEEVLSVSLSRDGRYAVSGGGSFTGKEWTVRLWEVATGRCVNTFEGHSGRINAACLSADGRYVVSGSDDMTIKLWRASLEIPAFRVPMTLSRLHASEETVQSAIAYEKEMIAARDALKRKDAPDAARHVRKARLQRGYERSAAAVILWSKLYMLFAKKAFCQGWDSGTFKGHSDAVRSLCLSGDGKTFFSGSDDAMARHWDIASGKFLKTFEGHAGSVHAVCLSPDGKYLLTGSADATVKLWSVNDGGCLRTFTGHAGRVGTLAVSPGFRFFMSASDDGTIIVWDVTSSRCLRTLKGHVDQVLSIAFSHDGSLLVSGSADCSIRLWDVASGTCIRIFEERTSAINSIAFDIDSRLIISGSDDQMVKVWNVETGELQHTFAGHAAKVTSVCLSLDGRFVFSASEDGSVKLWDLQDRAFLRSFEGHVYGVNAVCVAADGCFALSAGVDQAVKLWTLDFDLDIEAIPLMDERALSCLRAFLMRHTPCGAAVPQDSRASEQKISAALLHRGMPDWNDRDFVELLLMLGCAGYGRLRRSDVAAQLKTLASRWRNPEPLRSEVVRKPYVRQPEKGAKQSLASKKKKRSRLDLDLE